MQEAQRDRARRRRRLLLTAFLGTVALCGAPSVAAGASCPDPTDVVLIGVRGSGEPGKTTKHLGTTVRYVAQQLETLAARNGDVLRTHGLDYPAESVTTLLPTPKEFESGPSGWTRRWWKNRVNKFLSGIDEGIRKLKSRIVEYASDCADTDIVLVGFSQGAMVIDEAQRQLRNDGQTDALDAIAGTLLIADGDKRSRSEATLVGSSGKTGQGIRQYFRMVPLNDVVDPENTVHVCNKRDIICDFSLRDKYFRSLGFRIGAPPGPDAARLVRAFKQDIDVHLSYVKEGTADKGIDQLLEVLGYDRQPATLPTF